MTTLAQDALRFLGDDSAPVKWNCDILDKDWAIFNYIQYMFDRTNCMFRYTGLPDTIPEYMLEYMLQIYGAVAIIEHDGSVYATRANFGGPPDPYYRATQSVVANPALNIGKNYRIVNHFPPFERTAWEAMPPSVQFRNDSQMQGLLPMFARYAVQMAENDVSIRSAQINLRQQTLITANTGPEYESALSYMKQLEQGRLAAIATRSFLEGVKVANVGSGQSNLVTQLLELQQYLKASWYNEIGLNSNFNMKSQYVSSEELNSTADIMLPLIDNMFESRQRALEYVNSEFGLSITVEKNSAWEKKQLQADMAVNDPDSSNELAPLSPVDGAEMNSVENGDSEEITIPEQSGSVSQESNENNSMSEKLNDIDEISVEWNETPSVHVEVTVDVQGEEGENNGSEPDESGSDESIESDEQSEDNSS